MILRRPLFAGDDSKEQLTLIMDCIGAPNITVAHRVRKPLMRSWLIKQIEGGVNTSNRLEKMFAQVGPDAIDFLKKTLAFVPSDRLTCQELLEHPYMAALYSAADIVPGINLLTNTNLFDFEQQSFLNTSYLRSEIVKEIVLVNALEPVENGVFASETKQE